MPDVTVSSVAQSVGDAIEGALAPPMATGVLNFGLDAQRKNAWPGDIGNVKNPSKGADPFWVSEAIDPTRWDKRYPYELMVLHAIGSEGEVRYVKDPEWSFVLPIPPEELTITTPFASTVSATLGGIVEEHNGAPFRMITARGTTGVMPVRETAATNTGTSELQRFTGGLFAGAIQNGVQAVQTVAQQMGFYQLNLMNQANLDLATPEFAGRGTGYYQFHLLRMFLEGYVALKKRPEGKSKRLAFASWKDKQIWLVTPQGFELRRSAGDPLAYPYSFTMKAWRTVELRGGAGAAQDYRAGAASPALLQSVLGALSTARDTIESARGVIAAVKADSGVLLDAVRQTVLALKEARGVALSLADLPETIALNATAAGAALASGTASLASLATLDLALATNSADGKNVTTSNASKKMQDLATPTSDVFSNPRDHHEEMSSISISQLQLKPPIRRLIQEEISRAKKLQRSDFEKLRDDTLDFVVEYANAVGAGSTTYNDTYGKATGTTSVAPNELDYEILAAFNEIAMQMGRLSVQGPRRASTAQALDTIAGLARRSGIAFQTPVSKFAVPWPYQTSIEQVALRYLGDANRWMEIAALNGLRAPYVDEVGFEIPLIADGSGNELAVANAENLYVGQLVTVHSGGTRPVKRRITRIQPLSSAMVLVRVDGEEDMDRYLVMGGASIHAYLPDTVNSQQTIFIPSDREVEDELTSRAIPGIANVSGTIERGGVDLLLDESGDLVVTSEGDTRFAVGITNLVQRVRIAFGTTRGSLPQHPSFGFGLEVGMSTADLDAVQTLNAARGMFGSDPDFDGVTAARVEKNGNAVRIKLSVGVTGQSALLPVSLDVIR